MSFNWVVLVLIVAAVVAFVVWNRRSKGGDMSAGSPAYTPAPAGSSSAGAAGKAPASGVGGPLGSLEEYRRVNPSNMINGKLTCNRCGSNLLRTADGMASCTTCGASLYRT